MIYGVSAINEKRLLLPISVADTQPYRRTEEEVEEVVEEPTPCVLHARASVFCTPPWLVRLPRSPFARFLRARFLMDLLGSPCCCVGAAC